MSKADCIRLLTDLYPTNVGQAKAEVLYDLAQSAQGGAIVEVGTSRGYGAIALACGSIDGNGLPVYCIDPHLDVRGWANEPYGPEDRADWYHKISVAGVGHIVTLVGLPIIDVAHVWPWQVPLTFWDLGMRLCNCGEWLRKWVQHAMRSGDIVAINETGENNLGVDRWISESGMVSLQRVEYYIRITRKR